LTPSYIIPEDISLTEIPSTISITYPRANSCSKVNLKVVEIMVVAVCGIIHDYKYIHISTTVG
jgi:hypothetical protein